VLIDVAVPPVAEEGTRSLKLARDVAIDLAPHAVAAATQKGKGSDANHHDEREDQAVFDCRGTVFVRAEWFHVGS
jgi:hypothetical protein